LHFCHPLPVSSSDTALGGAVRRLANGDWFVRGHVAITDLVDYGLALPVDSDAYNSVGGFVFGELGRAGFAYSGQAMKAFNARFKASMNTPSFIMMMTTQEKKGNQLIQISKDNGDITSAVDIKNDREPEYDVDQIYNYVYYRPGTSEIVCYKL
jgi:hypothetical protein